MVLENMNQSRTSFFCLRSKHATWEKIWTLKSNELFFKKLFSFIDLTAPGLSCGMCDLLVVAGKLLVASCGIEFPDQGWILGPMYKVQSLSHWIARAVPLAYISKCNFICKFTVYSFCFTKNDHDHYGESSTKYRKIATGGPFPHCSLLSPIGLKLQMPFLNIYCLGQKVCSRRSSKYYGETRMNFLANPNIFLLSLFLF